MFYEVLQSASESRDKSPNSYDVDIYGYYIDTTEIVSLKVKVIEFVKIYKKLLNNQGIIKLYDITILPRNLLQKIFSLCQGNDKFI